MFTTTIVTAANRADHGTLLDNLFVLRHRIFVECLKWTLPMARNGREIDQFDDDRATYVVVSDARFAVRTSIRLHDTSEPTLLTGVFAHLVDGRLPSSSRIWEGTRMLVNPDAGPDGGRSLTELLYSCVEYGISQGCERFVSVSDRLLERILRRSGGAPHRLGSVVEVEPGIEALALEMECNNEALTRLAALTGRTANTIRRAA